MERFSPAYALMVGIGAIIAWAIRHRESKRLGYGKHPGYRYVGLSCLLGAVIGSKVGMIAWVDPQHSFDLKTWEGMPFDQFHGKTVLGAITGGYIFGELGKKLAGVRFSTGDALAVALPVAQGFGRIGCYFAGCCYGSDSEIANAIFGLDRHPVQLYESAACFLLAAWLWKVRIPPTQKPRPAGFLFRYYIIGYALIRFTMEFVRGEPQRHFAFLSWAQIYCLLMAISFLWLIWRPTAKKTHAPATS